jgi:hypothetical protein
MGGKGWGINRGFIRLRQNTLWLAQRRSSHGAHAAQALTRCKRLRCMCAVCATGMNGEVNRAVAQRAKAGRLRGASYLHVQFIYFS